MSPNGPHSDPRILFMGTPDFAVPSLDALVMAGLKPVAVATGPDKPRGRGRSVSPTPVKESARNHGIEPILQPEDVRSPAFAADVRALDLDLIVVVAFRILPLDVFKAARLGAFNLHGSLLPAYRGAAPINRAIMAGETQTGVTTFLLQEKVDTGNVLLKRTMPIGPDETAGDVHDRMMDLGAEAVVETARLILSGNAKPEPQNDALASPAPKIFKNDCRVNWNAPADQVHNQIRGLSPFPGAWTMLNDSIFKLYTSRIPINPPIPDPSGSRPGTILADGTRMFVVCNPGVVQVLELQQQGRKRLHADVFQNGHPFSEGDQFE